MKPELLPKFHFAQSFTFLFHPNDFSNLQILERFSDLSIIFIYSIFSDSVC